MNAKEFQTKSNNTFERQWTKKFNVLADEMKARARAKVLSERKRILDKRREECLHFLELEKTKRRYPCKGYKDTYRFKSRKTANQRGTFRLTGGCR